jgi:predicted Zn-dependent protease
VITQRDLVQRLANRNPGGWSVVERVQDLAIADERRGLQRLERRTRFVITVHRDVPLGRGTARLDIDAYDGSADDLVDQAISLAVASVGPAWAATPPAAPAKVWVVDDRLAPDELDAIAIHALAQLPRPARVTVTAALEVLHETVTVIASSGFHTSWPATALRAEATLTLALAGSPRPASLHMTRQARRLEDLALDAAIAAAAIDLTSLATAGPPSPGRCTLWLGPEAIIHGGDHGLWAVFAHQADSAVERRGLTRYHWRAELAPGAAQLAEPLSIASDGALEFATRSAPVADDAVAIRQFPLVDRGIAVGLGLSPAEAAFRGIDPNGGVRNLIVAPGTWSPAPSPTRRTVEIRRLRALVIDLTTGDASLDIALGFDHLPDRPAPIAFTGGTIRLDLIAALALARRSPQLLRGGAYYGPAALRIDDAELIP